MIFHGPILALLLQAPTAQPSAQPAAPEPASAPAPSAAYRGTFAQGLDELRTLALAKKEADALALSAALEPLARSDRERAALAYARGVTHARVEQRQPANAEFQHARADGQDQLRLHSIYNLGGLALQEAEGWYKQLPEVSGQPAQGQPAPVPVPAPKAAAAPGQPKPPDALAEARKAYLAAREHFVERLRAQWDDADTRADVELVQKRLKRLDEIEKQRKEQEQKQKDQQKQQDDKQKQDQKDKDKQDKQDPKDKQDKDQEKQDQPKDSNDPQKDKQEKPPEQPQDKDKDKQEQPKPEDQPKPQEQPQPKPADAQEKQLTQEEMTRLLDKLQELEKQADKLRAQIHKARRVAVKKDW